MNHKDNHKEKHSLGACVREDEAKKKMTQTTTPSLLPPPTTTGNLDSIETTDTLSPTRARRTTAPRNFVSADKVPPPTRPGALKPRHTT